MKKRNTKRAPHSTCTSPVFRSTFLCGFWVAQCHRRWSWCPTYTTYISRIPYLHPPMVTGCMCYLYVRPVIHMKHDIRLAMLRCWGFSTNFKDCGNSLSTSASQPIIFRCCLIVTSVSGLLAVSMYSWEITEFGHILTLSPGFSKTNILIVMCYIVFSKLNYFGSLNWRYFNHHTSSYNLAPFV